MRVEVEPGVHLYVDIEGAGLVPEGGALREQPTLILLHGGPGFDHSGFKPFFSRMADLAQIIYVDHRGHGRSDERPENEWRLDVFADDVVRLCRALGIVRPIVLGQSFGGFVAQRYLARHPAHPSRVILSSTTHHFGLERKLRMFEQLGGPEARALAEAFWLDPGADSWAAYDRVCRPLYNRTPQPPGATRYRTEILFAWIRAEQRAMNLRPGLAQAQCPVLVMAGDADPVTPIEDAEEIVAALPPIWRRFERFANVGHGAWRDDPDAALAALRRFIGAAGPFTAAPT
jgi:pimeloyl-ACP methyl ester carboxylesterase